MKYEKYAVSGMTCANCSKAVTEALLGVDGVNKAAVDLAKNQVHLAYDESKVDPTMLRKAVKRAGYDLILDNEKAQKQAKIKRYIELGFAVFFLLFGILFAITHIPGVGDTSFGKFFHNPITGIVFGTLAIIVLGLPTFKRAILALLSKRAGMDALISLSALSSYILSMYIAIDDLVNGSTQMTFFDALLMVLAIVTIGEFIEFKVKSLSGSKMESSLKTVHPKARLKYLNSYVEVEREQVLTGDEFLVPKGGEIPADGVITEGSGSIDLSSLTGESEPKPVKVGDTVYAGTLLVDGTISAKATSDAIDSLADKIEKEAYALSYRKGSLGSLSDKIAQWFVPAALFLAVLGFVLNYFWIAQGDWETSIIRGASVLVVSCPCAFGLAVPLTSLNGYYNALRHGVLFKSGSTFERVEKIQAAFFDKTGTLTTGEMRVVDYQGTDESLALAKALEAYSQHPIAKAIFNYRSEVKPAQIKDIEEIPGQGMKSEGCVLVKASEDDYQKLNGFGKDYSVSVLKDEKGEILAAFALKDEIVPGVQEALKELRKQGVEIYILTGDNSSSALRIGKELGFAPENVLSGLLPMDKAKAISEKGQGKFTAYVGDGINDLEALSAASLSIATQKAAPAARERADCVLLTPGMTSLPKAVSISRKAYRIIIENFIWAFAYNAALIPLTIAGILWMWLCAAAMIVSNITLMLNSLRASK